MSEQIKPTHDDVFLTSREVGDILGLHEISVRRMAKRGEFPNAFATEGGHIRIPKSDVDAYKAARRIVAPTGPATEGGAA